MKRLEKSVAIGLSVACASLLTIGSVQYYTVTALVRSNFWLAHTNQVLTEIEATISDVEKAESTARNYALTGEAAYVPEVDQALASASARERQVRNLTADNPRQQRRLAELEPKIAERSRLLHELVKARQNEGLQGAAQVVATDQGARVMNEIRSIARELKDEEYALLKQRSEAVEFRTKRATAIVVFGTFTALALIGIASLVIRKELTKREKLDRVLEQERQRFSTLLDNIPDHVYFKDREGRFTRVNKAQARWLGLDDPEQAIGKTDADFFSEKHARQARADELQIMRSNRPILDAQERETWAGRTDTWVRTSKLPLRDANGETIGTFGISRDITASKLAEEALEEANSKLTNWVAELQARDRERALLSELGELLQASITDEEAEGAVSKFAPRLFPNRSGAIAITKASRNLIEVAAKWGGEGACQPVFEPNQCWALRRGRLHHSQSGDAQVKCTHVHESFGNDYICVPMMARNEALGILHISVDDADGTISETEQRLASLVAERIGLALANLKLREELRSQSIRDPLTGLFNRRYMEESLDREIRRAKRSKRGVGAIMIDLDHFKRFNDTFGHHAGDHLLSEFGNLLRSRTRKEDIACRYGGEEFIVILPECNSDDTYRRAEELREAVKHMDLNIRDRSLGSVTASMGVAFFPDHASNSADLVHAADTALYQAKANGRDRVEIAALVYA